MEGITDAPMRDLQGATGAFSYAVSEFLRVVAHPIPGRVFRREIPELLQGGKTTTGLPVQVQILGGDPDLMALSAMNAVQAGATGIDINFGCPAPTVNRHDGGATLLKYPDRIEAIVRSVRTAVPDSIPVSAKLRLGWEDVEDIYENAYRVVAGGASWLTIHARTRAQGYKPPVFWKPIGVVRESLPIPVVANGDIWKLDDFDRCRDETGCIHYMIGRSALSNPSLPYQIAERLHISGRPAPDWKWVDLLQELIRYTDLHRGPKIAQSPTRLKQWLKLAANFGNFTDFEAVKMARSATELLECLDIASQATPKFATCASVE
ncbi:MAG: tRNA-dihydrouridine synthase family protein [Fimbriimonadaceae bacterium]|nr:tRNA-dihydrouridine synthase family protein [Fimbriimonadaceae bacterium]